MGSICKTSCDEVYNNISIRNRRLYYSPVAMPIMRLYDASSALTNAFFSSFIRVLDIIFSLLNFSECFCILFEFCLCRAFNVSHILTFFSTIITGDVVNISSGFFCFSYFVSPSSSPVFSLWAKITWLMTHLDRDCLL